MPLWVDILSAILGAIGTIFGILGITSYLQTRLKYKAEKANLKEEDQEALKLEQYLNQLKAIINSEVSPIVSGLEEIKADVILLKKGIQATCRNDLEEMFEKAEKQGFCTNNDKIKFEASYQVYHLLGKNGVMDAKRETLLKMPEKKP